MDILSKAVTRVGGAAGQSVAAAAFQRQVDAERRALADLRAQAYALRAQIGEEMFKLWQTRTLPPSSLDHLFKAVEQIMAAIADQRAVVDRLLAQRAVPDQVAPEIEADANVIDVQVLPPPPLPAAPTQRLAGTAPVPQPAGACPTCGATGVAGKPYCGYCGARLA